MTLAQGWSIFAYEFPSVILPTIGIWILGVVGLAAVCWDRQARKQSVFAVGFFLISVLAVCIGLYFRPHYFVLAFPAVALLVGVAVSVAVRHLTARNAHVLIRMIPIAVFAVAVIWPICAQGAFFFTMTPAQASRAMYGDNPFPESIQVANYIKNHTSPRDTIAILGSEPQIFFYSNRRSATGYIYIYSLMENQPYAHRMQQEMIAQIERAKPKYIIYVMIPPSWLMSRSSDRTIINWGNRYLAANYGLDGYVQVNPWGDGESDYYWGSADAVSAARGQQFGIQVFRRRS